MTRHNLSMLEISVGIPAFNEEANIGHLLKSLLSQRSKKVKIKEIIVIASGCTDRTAAIVKEAMKNNPRIKLFKQVKRSGKTSANNLFFQKAKSKILVLACADTLFGKDCLNYLVVPFTDPQVGITATRMIPLNDKNSLSGYFSHLWWRLFHKVALKHFRAGEILALRPIAGTIPKKIGADEVYLTDRILAKGYKAKYVPKAIGYNMGPQTLRDIIRMRRRHACLHFEFRSSGARIYYPKTMDTSYVFRLLLKELDWRSPKKVILTALCIMLEGFSRLLGYYDYSRREKKYLAWSRSESTKKLLSAE